MMEKVVLMKQQLTCRDIIDLIQIYRELDSNPSKKAEMVKYLKNHSKSFIVEEIDSLNTKDIL